MLVDSEIIAVEVEIALLSGIGLVYAAAEFKTRFMGMSDKAFYAALDEDCRARTGGALPSDFRPRVDAHKHDANETRLASVPGVEAVAAALGRPKAVASSSTAEMLEYKLRKTGLWQHFAPHIYSADHVTHAKPAPDLFLHAAAALEVAPADCLVIEDSVNGVRAGLAAGMRVWGFAGGGHMTPALGANLLAAGAERVVASWAEFQGLIE